MWTSENRPKYNRDKLRYPSDLTDDEWSHVEPLIPPAKRGGRKRSVEPREIVNGLMYILSTGCQWAALPQKLPPRSTVNDYLRRGGTMTARWSASTTRSICGAVRWPGREASPTAAIIDSQSVKSAEKGGPASIRMATMRARVRLEGACHLWRKIPSRELSINPEADERHGWATGLAEAS